jgi:hypothetical protein
MRRLRHTHRSVHDNIGPRPATATCVTTVPATLVTNLYGQPADQVHQRDRLAAGVPK